MSASDAEFVDIIHTDAGMYGTSVDSGTVDFKPNNGMRYQPGCPITFKFMSDEGKSFSFF